MKREFNTVLQAGVEEHQAEEEKQDKLKKKFGIKGKNVVVVEKNNTFTFTVKTIGFILRFIATVVIIGLAFVGIVALFYDAPRRELFTILNEAIDQINQTIPIRRFLPSF